MKIIFRRLGGCDGERNASFREQHVVADTERAVSLREELLAADSEGMVSSRETESSAGGREQRTNFQQQLLATLGEQRGLIMEYKEAHDRRLFEIAENLTGELHRLSADFVRLCDRNKELEQTVAELRVRVKDLECSSIINQERLVTVHAGMLATSRVEIVKQEIRDEFVTALDDFRKEMVGDIKMAREQPTIPQMKRESYTGGGNETPATARTRVPPHTANGLTTCTTYPVLTPAPVEYWSSTAEPFTSPQAATESRTGRLLPPISTATTRYPPISQYQPGASRPVQKTRNI